ncbi:MAG: hypothetical protein NTU53_18215 [Planctomycetota bacterium]|nr:hypothetical protein [Planctomycetota bacterium]
MRPPVHHIDYGIAPRRRRWLARAVLLLVVMIAGLLAARRWVPPIRQYANDAAAWRQAQQKCLRFVWATGEVVFDEETQRATVGLLDQETGRPVKWRSSRQNPVIVNPQTRPTGKSGNWPRCWAELQWGGKRLGGPGLSLYSMGEVMTYDAVSGTGSRSVTMEGPSGYHDECRFFCFLHARRAPGGPEELVAVGFDGGGFIWGDPNPFWACVMKTGLPDRSSWRSFTRVKDFSFTCDPQKRLRIFAGQPDPNDASHFTIAYEAGDTKAVIDGWLKDDDTIVLKLRP